MKGSVLALSAIGTIAFIVGFHVALAQNEVHVLTAKESIIYGLILAAGLALMVAGLRFATWKAAIVEALVLFLFYVFVYPGVFGASPGRGRQVTTMANIHTLAVALEARATDTNEYPRVRTIDQLVPLLEPTYLKHVPRSDAWGHPWRYEGSKDHYAIGSAGRDGKFEKASLRQYPKTATSNFDDDLVYRDGEWISYPKSFQTLARADSVPPTATTTDPKALFDQATSLYRADRFSEAVPLFEQYLRTNPNDALAHARIGICLGQLGRLEESIPYLQKAIAADPTDYQSRSNLGLVYEKLKRPEEGVEWVRAAAKIKPDDPDVLNNLGWVLLQAGRSAEAVSVFERAVRLAPSVKLYRENLARAKKDAGRRRPS